MGTNKNRTRNHEWIYNTSVGFYGYPFSNQGDDTGRKQELRAGVCIQVHLWGKDLLTWFQPLGWSRPPITPRPQYRWVPFGYWAFSFFFDTATLHPLPPPQKNTKRNISTNNITISIRKHTWHNEKWNETIGLVQLFQIVLHMVAGIAIVFARVWCLTNKILNADSNYPIQFDLHAYNEGQSFQNGGPLMRYNELCVWCASTMRLRIFAGEKRETGHQL